LEDAVTITPATLRTYRHLTATQADHLAELWNATYPAMREILDRVIRANRGTDRPVADVPRLERVRRELGQIDRGTHRPCTQSPPGFSPTEAYILVGWVLEATSLGSPHAGGIHRLAAELADLMTTPHPPHLTVRRAPDQPVCQPARDARKAS
jgi:hypothetical protein